MNILIGVNMAYLSFVPNAGNSILFSIIALLLYVVLSFITLILCCKVKINLDNYPILFPQNRSRILYS